MIILEALLEPNTKPTEDLWLVTQKTKAMDMVEFTTQYCLRADSEEEAWAGADAIAQADERSFSDVEVKSVSKIPAAVHATAVEHGINVPILTPPSPSSTGGSTGGGASISENPDSLDNWFGNVFWTMPM